MRRSVLCGRRDMGDMGPNAGYMVAAYVVTAIVYLGYFVRLSRSSRGRD